MKSISNVGRIGLGNATLAILLGALLPVAANAADTVVEVTSINPPAATQPFTYKDGVDMDLVNGLVSGAAGGAVLHPATGLSDKIAAATLRPIYPRPVMGDLMTDSQIDDVMEKITSSPGRHLGVGSMGGADVEISLDQAALKQVLAQRNLKFLDVAALQKQPPATGATPGIGPTTGANFTAAQADYETVQLSLRGLPDSDLRALLVGLKDAGVTVESIGFRNIAGQALVKLTAAASLTALASGAAKILHAGGIALSAPGPVLDSKTYNAPMQVNNQKESFAVHFYSDAIPAAIDAKAAN